MLLSATTVRLNPKYLLSPLQVCHRSQPHEFKGQRGGGTGREKGKTAQRRQRVTERDANRRRRRRKLLSTTAAEALEAAFCSDGETEKEENVYAQSTRSLEHAVGDGTVGRKKQNNTPTMLNFSSGESQHHRSSCYVTLHVCSRR